MTRALSGDDLRGVRARAQLLAGEPAGTVAAAVARVGAVQAQAAGPARLAVRARTRGLTAALVDAATAGQRAVVRTWLMRGTLHMVAATDVGWMVGLLGPVNRRAGRRRRAELGLDDATCERAVAALPEVLRGGRALARAELVARLADQGVRVAPDTQAPAHLLGYAASHGVICRGPDRAAEPTYVLLDEWTAGVPGTRPGDPLAELARRYLTGHGPATAADLAAWSGLAAADAARAVAAIADQLVEVEAAGSPAVALAASSLEPPGTCPPRLLGQFDGYLLGYRSRDLVLDPRYGRRIRAGGMIQPAVLVGGRVVGTWRLRRGRRASVLVEPFGALPRASLAGLRAEAADLGRFLGMETTLETTLETADNPGVRR